MEIASWLGPYAGGTEYDEGRPYISAIDGPGGPIITADHLTRDSTTLCAAPRPLYCMHYNYMYCLILKFIIALGPRLPMN